jgi:AraC-like DNA-binding protein
MRGTYVLDQLEALERRVGGCVFAGGGLALPAQLTSWGHEERTSTDYDWHGLKRGSAEFCLLQYTLAGRGQLSWEGRRYTVQPGQAMLLWFPHDNRYWLARGDRWRHVYLCLSGHEVQRSFRAVVARRGPLVDLGVDSPVLAALADAVAACQADRIRDPFTASAAAYRIAMALSAELLGAPPHVGRQPAIEAAKRAGQADFAKGIDVADLSRVAGLSRHHFSRLFQRCEGLSPSRWLADLRAREAARLLRSTTLSVAEVGARCGYADAAYFCRAFRRMLGVSPGEFRTSGMY